jgi:excisionase family DNA binding protein
MNAEKLGLTVQEAADRSGIGRTRIFAAIKAGLLPARKFGRRTIILAADLENFLRGLPVKNAA